MTLIKIEVMLENIRDKKSRIINRSDAAQHEEEVSVCLTLDKYSSRL